MPTAKRSRVERAIAQCEPTISREVRYWQSQFRRQLTRDDLRQEAALIVAKVLRYYDPERGASLDTFLTLALRQHFRRLVKATLLRAFVYTPAQQVMLEDLDRRRVAHPAAQLDARLAIAKLERMPAPHQRLACALLDTGGDVTTAAKRLGWPLSLTKARAHELRDALRKETE